jgi:hypothetical protein
VENLAGTILYFFPSQDVLLFKEGENGIDHNFVVEGSCSK